MLQLPSGSRLAGTMPLLILRQMVILGIPVASAASSRVSLPRAAGALGRPGFVVLSMDPSDRSPVADVCRQSRRTSFGGRSQGARGRSPGPLPDDCELVAGPAGVLAVAPGGRLYRAVPAAESGVARV